MNRISLNRSLTAITLMALLLSTALSFTLGARPSHAAAAQDNAQAGALPGPTGGCPGYREYVGGKNDKFALPPDPTIQSPALAAFLATLPNKRQFDEVGPNKAFGHSIRLCTCRIARAELEIGVRAEQRGPNSSHTSSDSGNDSLTIGEAPFTSGTWKRVYSDYIWPAGNAGGNNQVFNIPLSAANLNNWMINTPNGHLDFYIQDDTGVDYIKLKVWYF